MTDKINKVVRIQKALEKNRIDGLLVSSAINIGYLTDFFGFSKDEREAFVLLMDNKQYLATDGRYIEEVRKVVKNFEIVEITPNNPLKKILAALVKKHKIKRLGFEKNNLTVGELEKFSFRPAGLTHGVANIIEELRTVKEPHEITAIEKACALGDKTFDYILTKIKPEISEKELAFEIEFFIKKQGADISFSPIVAFGANSSVPHHQTSNQQLAASNQLILLDFGVKIDNYCSDMTRTVFFGKATSEQKKMYNTVLAAQQKAIEYLERLTSDGGRTVKTPRGWPNGLPRGGEIKAVDVDRVARDYIINAGFPTIPHSLGHGIGLEVHELPRLSPKSKDILKPGMVFSVEPGIYVPGFGGVRIEDLVMLEPSGLPRRQAGPHLLTKSPKQIIEI